MNPETDEPHIYKHEVDENEIIEIFHNLGEDQPGSQDSRIAIGQTDSGRWLRVIYVRDEQPGSVFVITAYDLMGKQLLAYRRRSRKKEVEKSNMNATQKRQNQFPKGWDEKRVLQVLAHYEKQSDEETIAEAEKFASVETLAKRHNPSTLWATVKGGRIMLLDDVLLPEGSRVLVTLLPDLVPVA